jgi:Protein of unknown function (DUF3551)
MRENLACIGKNYASPVFILFDRIMEANMRATLAASAVLIGTFASGVAMAEIDYPWCITTAQGGFSCRFTSFEQCRSGGLVAGSFCSQNPRYQGPKR